MFLRGHVFFFGGGVELHAKRCVSETMSQGTIFRWKGSAVHNTRSEPPLINAAGYCSEPRRGPPPPPDPWPHSLPEIGP